MVMVYVYIILCSMVRILRLGEYVALGRIYIYIYISAIDQHTVLYIQWNLSKMVTV